ncbi:MAG: hypothetical protein RIB59_09870 [Rhodospirillales bacterium]
MRYPKPMVSLLIAGSITGAFLNPSVASAVDFSGKTITNLVPSPAGAGTDKFARMFAPFFKKYLPGNPTIIIQNMPGGSTIRGNNWFEKNAKPDGMMYVGITASSQTSFLLGGKKIKFDMTKWAYIVAAPRGNVFYALPSTGVKGKNIRDDMAALRKAKLIAGMQNATSAELRDFLAFELLGLTVKPVTGVKKPEQRKAILRGELNIGSQSAGAYIKHITKYVEKGQVVPVMTLGFSDADGNIVRDPGLPKIPTIIDIYKAVNGGKMPSGALWDTYKNFYSIGVMTSKGLALPKGTPKAIVAAYVQAAKKTAEDKKFQKIAKKALGQYPLLFDKDATKAFADAVTLSPAAKAFVKKFVKEKFDVNI